MENKNQKTSIFAPLLRIHDTQGEFQTLLQANGFQVKDRETELLMAMSKWHRMTSKNEKIPHLDIKNINKFRDEHMAFLQSYYQEKEIVEMQKQEKLARERLEKVTGEKLPKAPLKVEK